MVKQVLLCVCVALVIGLLGGCSKEEAVSREELTALLEEGSVLEAVKYVNPRRLRSAVREILELDEDTELDAQKYNSAGYALYQEKRYAEAAILFSAAVKLRSDYEFANYNLACSLALLKGQGEDIDSAVIVSIIERSLELDPEKIEHIKTDADLDAIRNEPEFQAVLSAAAEAEKSEAEARKGVTVEDREKILVGGEVFLTLADIIEAMEASWNAITGGKAISIMDEELRPADFYTIGAASLSPCGKRIFFAANRYFAATDINVYGVIFMATGKFHFFQDGIKHGQVMQVAWAPDGQHIACYTSDATGASRLYVAATTAKTGKIDVRGSKIIADRNNETYDPQQYMEGHGSFDSIAWDGNSVLRVAVKQHAEGGGDAEIMAIDVSRSTSDSIRFVR